MARSPAVLLARPPKAGVRAAWRARERKQHELA